MLSISDFYKILLSYFLFFLIFIKPGFCENISNNCDPKNCESLCCSSRDYCASEISDCQRSACDGSLCTNKCCVNGQCGTYDQCQQTQRIVVIILTCLMGLFAITFFIICSFAMYSRFKKRQIINRSDNTIDRNPEVIRTDQIPFMEPQQTKKEKIPLQEIEIGGQPISRRFCFNSIQINQNKKMNTEQQIPQHIKGLPLTIALTDGPVKVTEEFEQISQLDSEVSSSNVSEIQKELKNDIDIDQKIYGYVQKQFQSLMKKVQNEQMEDESEELNETDVKRTRQESQQSKKSSRLADPFSLSFKKINQKSRFINCTPKQIEEGNINNNKDNQQNQNEKQN